MAISSRFTKLRWSPQSEADRGTLGWRISGTDAPASGRPQMVGVSPGRFLIPVTNEGSRTGDGNAVLDPYGYENNAVDSVDYRPIGVPGVVPNKGLSAFGFGPSGRGAITTGSFVDDTNTGVPTQVPNTPGRMMILSGEKDGLDGGFLPGIPQPRTLITIHRYGNAGSAFSPILDLNGGVATGIGNSRDDAFLYAGYRATYRNSAAGVYVMQPDTPPQPGEWVALIFRKEAAAVAIYSGITGAVIVGDDLGTTAAYEQDTPVVAGLAVHTFGGRRYNVAANQDPEYLRQRDFTQSHVQESIGIDRLVDVPDIVAWILATYPGIENEVTF